MQRHSTAKRRNLKKALLLQTEQTVDTLRVGLLIESFEVSSWVAASIEAAAQQEGVKIVGIFLNPVPRSTNTFWTRLIRSRRYLLWRAYTLLDKAVFGELPDAFSPTSIQQMLSGIPIYHLSPEQSRFVDHFDQTSVHELIPLKLDVCLNFCHRILRGAILNTAAYGVWSLHHGDGNRYRGGPPGFWELMERNPVTGTMLQVLSERLDGGVVLDRSWSATDQTSLIRTTNRLFWKSSTMMSRGLKKLMKQKTPIESPPSSEGRVYSRPLYKPPVNHRACWYLLPHISRAVGRRFINSFQREQWQLLYSTGSSLPTEMRHMRRIQPPSDRLWADPMAIEVNGRVFVFIEELIYRRNNAHISVMEYDRASSSFSTPYPVLQRPYHLSYPHVFEAEGQYWMVPETSANRQIELYVADQFPGKWRLAKILMKNCDAVDATLYRHDGEWWMFVGMAATSGASHCDETFLFRADRFDSSHWTPHPANPIVSDVRRARPAGPILMVDDCALRPSQDCSIQYGYGLRLNRIDVLSRDHYEEHETAFITPTWDRGLHGIHHVSNAGGLTVMDVSVRRLHFPDLPFFRRDNQA